MINKLPLLLFLLLSSAASAQIGVSYHQSGLPFVGVNYPLGERFITELRVGVDTYIEGAGVELMGGYFLRKDPSMEAYVGLGARFNVFDGVILPIGLHVYPFEQKRFGFHMELAGIYAIEDGTILRGSGGIRYRFSRDD